MSFNSFREKSEGCGKAERVFNLWTRGQSRGWHPRVRLIAGGDLMAPWWSSSKEASPSPSLKIGIYHFAENS